METANNRFVEMKALLEGTGRLIADLLDAESALVTSGAAAALALAAASCLTRDHRDYLERLPDTAGIPNEIVTQKSTRQKYDRCVTLTGAHLIEAGNAQGCTIDELRAAFGPNTAAVHYFVPFRGEPVLPLEIIVEIAHEHRLPVIVDAAGLTWPLDELRRYTRSGADLVCYAAKYFDAPHSTGLLVGRKDLIDLALINSFVGFETSGSLTVGRPMKVDRQEIVGCVVALREWLSMDHEARLSRYGERIEVILQALRGIPGIEAFRISERETPIPVIRDGVRVMMPSAAAAAAVEQRLREGDPSIAVRTEGNAVNVSVAFFEDADLAPVAQRIREALNS
jgi:L-seryl-tRNA(Ser) seleniumtransferase